TMALVCPCTEERIPNTAKKYKNVCLITLIPIYGNENRKFCPLKKLRSLKFQQKDRSSSHSPFSLDFSLVEACPKFQGRQLGLGLEKLAEGLGMAKAQGVGNLAHGEFGCGQLLLGPI